MKRSLWLTFAACLSAILLTAEFADAQSPLAPLAKMEVEDGDSLVFLGDSITHQCLYTQYVEDYLYTRFPGKRFRIHNAGVGGARAWDALARFDDDVAAYKPKYVTILLGMNDGTYQPFNQDVFDTYRRDMTKLVGKLESIGAKPIPMTPTMFDSRADAARGRDRDPESRLLYNSVLAYYGTWLREVAQEKGYGFVDMWSPLNQITLDQRKADPNFTMIADAVHPGPVGQVVMATAIVGDMGLPRQVSNIRISHSAKGKPVARTAGGKLTDLAWSETAVEFNFHASSLPWVLPEEAQLGAKLTKLGHRLSKESLEIHGLAPGNYQLSIDGHDVGTYSDVALARHIELQDNAKTPQYQQAAKVAELNKKRNEGPVRGLRGQWSQFQQYARARRLSDENPENADFKAKYDAAAAKNVGLAERVAEFNKSAKEIEDEIFQVNQPVVRQYRLVRVQ